MQLKKWNKPSTIVLRPHCCHGDGKSRSKANKPPQDSASDAATLAFHMGENGSTPGHMFSCAVRCFVGKISAPPEMVLSLTTDDADSFFMSEPEDCQPSTNGPGPHDAWGRLMPIRFFRFFYLFRHSLLSKTIKSILLSTMSVYWRWGDKVGGFNGPLHCSFSEKLPTKHVLVSSLRGRAWWSLFRDFKNEWNHSHC